MSGLLKDLEEINAYWICIISGIGANASRFSYRAQRVKPDSGRGTPKVVIEQEKIEFLRELDLVGLRLQLCWCVPAYFVYNKV